MLDSQLVVGVDIGTTKVCALVGEARLSSRTIDILGVGLSANRGMDGDAIRDPHAVAGAIREALNEAEQAADVTIYDVVFGIGGSHVASQSEIGAVDTGGRVAIVQEQVVQAIERGAAVHLPVGREVLYVSARDFSIDGQPGVRDPLGRTGRHLQADVRIVSGAVSARRELEECLRGAKVQSHQWSLRGLATGLACLGEEEREAGVVLIDLGGGGTEIACFRRGALAWSGYVPVGGDRVTLDVAECLGTSFADAERLKAAHARAMPEMADPERELEYRDVETDDLMLAAHSLLCEIVEARVEEILDLCRAKLLQSGMLSAAPAGIVLAGGGSLLPGVVDLARNRFGGMLVRTARAVSVGAGFEYVSGPSNLTALGLALHATELAREEIARRRALGPWKSLLLALRELLRLGKRA